MRFLAATRDLRNPTPVGWTPRADVRYVRWVQRDVGNAALARARSTVTVCVLATGRSAYYGAARGAVRSVLRHTPFDAFVAVGEGRRWRKLHDARVRVHVLDAARPRIRHRAGPFLDKLHALDACLRETRAQHMVLLDGDARFVGRVDEADVERALDGRSLAMAEQTTIRGSGMSRADFLEHYVRHPLAWLDRSEAPPRLEAFRYFNSGVVLARRDGLEAFLAWALPRMRQAGDAHQAGEHMIADQDYLQLWTNTLQPGCCTTLPWEWNHCEHWDDGFPRRGARIVHSSNFCRGPSRTGALRLAARLALARVGWALGDAARPARAAT